MNHLVLFMGNKYGPGMGGAAASLKGCASDGNSLYYQYKKLFPAGRPKVNCIPLLDDGNTKSAQDASIIAALKSANPDEFVHIHDSSHGTTVPVAGQNVGAIVTYDATWRDPNTFQLASNLKNLFNTYAKPGTKIFLTIDACEFGDSVRGNMVQFYDVEQRTSMPRFIEPPIDQQILIDQNETNGAIHRAVTDDLHNVCSIAGCKRGKGFTCADVRVGNRAYGAFTEYMIPLWSVGPASKLAEQERAVLTQHQFEQQPVFSGQDWELPR